MMNLTPRPSAPETPMPEPMSADETLTRLARSRVATHLMRFSDQVMAEASMDDEVLALEHLSDLLNGPIYRVAPLTYAFECKEDHEALARNLAIRLGGCEPPVIEALPTPDDAPTGAFQRDALTLMTAFARPDDSFSDGRRLVIDARAALAAADVTATRIDEMVARLEARLAETLADRGMANDDADEATEQRLARIEEALTALAARAPEAGADPEQIARIETALAELSGREPGGDAEAIARIEGALAERDAAIAAAVEGLARVEAVLAEAAAAPAPEGLGAALDDRLAAIEAALGASAPTDPALTGRLDRIEAALAAPDETMAARLDAIEAALSAPAEGAGFDGSVFDGALNALMERLAALETAVSAADPAMIERLAALEAAVAAPADVSGLDASVGAMADRLAAIETAVAAPATADPVIIERLAALEAAFEATQARPAPAPTTDPELTGRLDRLDAALDRLLGVQTAAVEAATGVGPALTTALDRLSAIETTLAAQPAGDPAALAERIEDMAGELRALAERPTPAPDMARERDALTRLSSALQTTIGRMDAGIDRIAAAGEGAAGVVVARIDALERSVRAQPAPGADAAPAIAALTDEVRALADRAGGGLDLRRERESLSRLSFSLQTAVSRLDGEVSRLIEADLGGGAALAEQFAALGDSLAPLAERLEAIEAAGALSADHSGALVELVQSVREECAELHGLHGRYFEALGAAEQGRGVEGEDLMDRISGTLAEFLARLERFEAQRAPAAPARPAASLLASRLGRTS